MAKHGRVGETQHLVLQAVAKLQPDAFGIAIQSALEEATLRDMNIGSLYGTLHRLEDRGFLSAREGDEEPAADGRLRRKRYYALTPAGRRLLADIASEDAVAEPSRLGWLRPLRRPQR